MDYIKNFEDKLEKIESFLTRLERFDLRSKDIINKNGYIKDNLGNDVMVGYAKNAQTLEGKDYETFLTEMKDFFSSYIETLKKDIIKINSERPLDTHYSKDWTDFKPEGDFWYGSIDTLNFTPSYYTVSFKLEGCTEKNGGTNGIIVEIPSVGISNSGLPFDLSNPNSVKNYSGHWFENGHIMMYVKKGPNSPWIGSCSKMQYKIKAWV